MNNTIHDKYSGLGRPWRAQAMLRRLRRWLLLRDPDLKYIVQTGVDNIPEVEDPVTPKASLLGAASSSLDRASLFLDSEDALRYFIQGMEERMEYTARLLGARGGLILLLAASPRKLEGPWLLVVEGEEGWVSRLLVYNGVVTAAQAMTATGPVYGRQALGLIEDSRGEARVVAIRLRRRLVEWDPGRLSVYVRGIDRQHMFLVANLNMLYLGLVAGEDRGAMEEVLGNLGEYTKFHFRSEERIMDKFNYPEELFSRHRREHSDFVEKVTGFTERYRTGEAEITLDLLGFLAAWLQGHIAGTDRRLGRWLKYEARVPIVD